MAQSACALRGCADKVYSWQHMDITKQYPKLALNHQDATVFEIESFLTGLGLSTIDLINLSRSCDRGMAESLGARSGASPEEVFNILQKAKQLFISNLEPGTPTVSKEYIPTSFKSLDSSMHGGIPLGQITEVFGASGCGKSQFLLSLAVRALVAGTGNESSCVYISTEATLESRRLDDFSSEVPGALDRVSYVYCPDLDNQDHILFTQLRLKLEEGIKSGRPVRMVIIDSVSHHMRAEDTFLNTLQFFRSHLAWQEDQLLGVPTYRQEKAKFDAVTSQHMKGDVRFRNRTLKKYYLFTLYSHLAELALSYNVAVVLANQVSDVMDAADTGNNEKTEHIEEDPLSFDFQVGTFLGWDAVSLSPYNFNASENETKENGENRKRKMDEENFEISNENRNTSWNRQNTVRSGPRRKVPAMGYTWSKLIPNRILLWKAYLPIYERARDHEPIGDAEKGLLNEQITNHSTDADQATKSSTETASSIAGFNVRRYARAVSGYNQAGATAEFEISQTGLYEVHAGRRT